MNTESSPIAIDDKEFVWRENFIRLGDGHLRTVWDAGSTIYTAPLGTTIVWFGFFVINQAYYSIVFLSDGSAIQVNMIDHVTTVIGTSGFYSTTTGFLPYVRSWGNQFLLISNRNTVNDYWVWDGKLLYTAGTAAPQGVNILSGGFDYSSAPTITTYGGQGSGMTFTTTEQAGAVVAIDITNPGTGYEVGDVPQLAFTGGGSDTSAELIATINAGGVGGVNITAPGSGYTSATVAFTGGGGTGAAGTVIINTGVTSVAVTAGGTNYTYATVTFSGGGGTGATAVPNITGGVITSVTVTNSGANYTSAPTPTLNGTGTGATLGTVTIGGGLITGVQITSPGSGYVTAPTVAFSGTGTGATGTALLSPSGVSAVGVINPGTGFTSPPLVSFVGGGGAGATGFVELEPTSIASVNLTAGGSNYTITPVVAFIGGGGEGASAICIMNGGSVGRIQMISGGAGYTTAVEVQINLPPDAIEFNTALANAPTNPAGLLPFTGGGAGGVAVYVPTGIAGVVVSAAGQFYTSAPAVEISAGANNSAYATVNLMPYGISGSAMESFLSRVWIIAPAQTTYATIPGTSQFNVSAPNSVWDFSPADGGEFQSNVDSFLQTEYTGVRQSSGYLYFLGDESVNVVSNVATSGSPLITTFNYQNVDPQSGLSWRDSLADFGRAELMANTIGVFGLYGGAATKISAKMDGVFRGAVFPPFSGALTPSAAVATIFDVKHYMCLMTLTDPDTKLTRNAMIAWNEKDWCILSQSPALNFINTQPVGTTFNAYGTDGTQIYPLFTTPSTKITKRLETKYYGAANGHIIKQFLATWLEASDMSVGSLGIAGTLTAVVGGSPNMYATPDGEAATIPNQIFSTWTQPLSFQSPSPYFATWGAAPAGPAPFGGAAYVAFTTLGLRLSSTSPDFILGNWMIGYHEVRAIF